MAAGSSREAKKSADIKRILLKEEEQTLIKQVRRILKKSKWEQTPEEIRILDQYPEMVQLLLNRMEKQVKMKDRLKEVEDCASEIKRKSQILADAIREAESVMVYTGAGISTAAHIPDYRGPSGIWTLLQKGAQVSVQDLSTANPTYSHMAIAQLFKEGYLKHVVSQNCDGLHTRSGLPQSALSEIHGNMYTEACTRCKPLRQYFRLFDVTEKTSLRKHKTGRKCRVCSADLIDTVVHFGERGRLRWPLNWDGAVKAVKKSDTIICLGSSLKVLKKYQCLWAVDRQPRPKLFIVNLQWTPKDEQASLKINGKCDEVMKHVMEHLGIDVPKYSLPKDQIFKMATPLIRREMKTTTRLHLQKRPPVCSADETKEEDEIKVKSEGWQHVLADHRYIQTEDDPPVAEASEAKRQKLSGWYGKGYSKGTRKNKKL